MGFEPKFIASMILPILFEMYVRGKGKQKRGWVSCEGCSYMEVEKVHFRSGRKGIRGRGGEGRGWRGGGGLT
jgi:hypothetical protein